MEPLRIIDSHVHLTDRLCGFSPYGEVRPIGGGKVQTCAGNIFHLIPDTLGDKEFLAETYIQMMEQCGIEKAVLLQAGFYGFVNEYLYAVSQKYPNRLIPAGSYDPYCIGASAVLNRLLQEFQFKIFKFELSTKNGIAGCHPGMRLDDEQMCLSYDRLSTVQASVAMDIGEVGSISYQPEAIARIAARYPELHFIICHLMVSKKMDIEQWKKNLELFSNLSNVWFDLAALPPNLDDREGGHPLAWHIVQNARDIIGPEKLIWGSDVPSVLLDETYDQTFHYLCTNHLFTEQELQKIMYTNAQTAYRLS